MRLTRDDDPPVTCRLEFEYGVITWQDSDPAELQIETEGYLGQHTRDVISSSPEVTFEQAFVIQICDAIDAVRTGREPMVDPRSTLPALELIESCYSDRRLMPMPWLNEREKQVVAETSARSA